MKKYYIIPAITTLPIRFASCLCESGTSSDSISVGDAGADQGGARAPHHTAVF